MTFPLDGKCGGMVATQDGKMMKRVSGWLLRTPNNTSDVLQVKCLLCATLDGIAFEETETWQQA